MNDQLGNDVGDTDIEDLHFSEAITPKGVCELLPERKDRLRVPEYFRPIFSQRDPSTDTLEKASTEGILQGFNLCADSRLRQVQLPRGFGY